MTDPIRPPAHSWEEISERLDAVERSRSSTPPAIAWIRKMWWKASIAALVEAAGHWLHEVIARGSHWR